MNLDLSSVADANVVLPSATAQPSAPTPNPSAPAAAVPPPATPKAATLQELKATCAGAPADFVLAQLEAGATLAVASAAWMKTQADEIKTLKEQQAAATPANAQGKKPGAPRVPAAAEAAQNGGGGSSGDPIAAFEDAVLAEMERSKCARHAAHIKICQTQPELREAMTAAHNVKFGKRR